MTLNELIVETRGSTMWLTLDRPDAMNALSPGLVSDLESAMHEAELRPEVRCVAITGSGRAFCVGADLSFALDALVAGDTAEFVQFLEGVGQVFRSIESFPKPVIAALNGITLAGGLELAMCCDLIFASKSARIGDSHANFGLLPGAGGAVRLPRLIGAARAKKLLFTGEMIPASELVAAGLVNEVVADEELVGTVEKTAELIASKSPLGIRRMKSLVNDTADESVEDGLRAELALLVEHLQSEDMAEGLRAFRDKRKPEFRGS